MTYLRHDVHVHDRDMKVPLRLYQDSSFRDIYDWVNLSDECERILCIIFEMSVLV